MWQYCVIVAQSCLTLCNPSPPIPWLLCPWNSPDKNIGVGSHSLLQARGSFQPRDWTRVSCIAGRFFYHLSHQGSPEPLERLYGNYIFNHLRNWQTVSQSGGTILHSHQQCAWFPLFLYLCQCLLLSDFLIPAILVSMK